MSQNKLNNLNRTLFEFEQNCEMFVISRNKSFSCTVASLMYPKFRTVKVRLF